MTDNEERADKAFDACGSDSSQEAITDLLTNLRHLAARAGLDFAQALIASEMHYDSER